MSLKLVIFASFLVAANAQRSPYAGSRPGSGYKDRFVPNNDQSTTTTTNGVNSLADRFGNTNNVVQSTTVRLPYDALGDAAIVNHYNSLPIDQRPFWIVNQQHIEAHRGTPPRPVAASGNTQTTVARPLQESDIVNRFGTRQPENQPDPSLNAISQQEIVYPSNISAEQRLQMEILFTQQRLQALQDRQRQQQAQAQSQLTGNVVQQGNFVGSRRGFF